MLFAHMTCTDKPHLGAITEKSRAADSVAMARLLHGDDGFEQRCVIMGNVNTNSPLLVDKVVTEAAAVYCGAGQGIVAVPFILSGAMGPVTTAAAIAQALAEAMIVGAFAQLVRPGAPFVLGNFLSSMNLRSGAPTFGMPEPLMSNLVIGQLARRLNLPLRCGGALTASKVADFQAAAESADSMLLTVLGGANFVLHAAGWLEGGLTTATRKWCSTRTGSAPMKSCCADSRPTTTPWGAMRTPTSSRAVISWVLRTRSATTPPRSMNPRCPTRTASSSGKNRAARTRSVARSSAGTGCWPRRAAAAGSGTARGAGRLRRATQVAAA